MDITWRDTGGQNVGKGTGNKKHEWQVQNRQGKVKNSMGNGEAIEFICMDNGHELRWENGGGRWGIGNINHNQQVQKQTGEG